MNWLAGTQDYSYYSILEIADLNLTPHGNNHIEHNTTIVRHFFCSSVTKKHCWGVCSKNKRIAYSLSTHHDDINKIKGVLSVSKLQKNLLFQNNHSTFAKTSYGCKLQ